MKLYYIDQDPFPILTYRVYISLPADESTQKILKEFSFGNKPDRIRAIKTTEFEGWRMMSEEDMQHAVDELTTLGYRIVDIT